MTGHENLFKVIPGLLSDVNTVHQTSISLLIVAPAPERRFGGGNTLKTKIYLMAVF